MCKVFRVWLLCLLGILVCFVTCLVLFFIIAERHWPPPRTLIQVHVAVQVWGVTDRSNTERRSNRNCNTGHRSNRNCNSRCTRNRLLLFLIAIYCNSNILRHSPDRREHRTYSNLELIIGITVFASVALWELSLWASCCSFTFSGFLHENKFMKRASKEFVWRRKFQGLRWPNALHQVLYRHTIHICMKFSTSREGTGP